MVWFLAILAVLVLGLAAVAYTGRLGEFGPPVTDEQPFILPDGDLTSNDLEKVRFGVTWRGYRPEEVEALISKMTAQLRVAEGNPAWAEEPSHGPEQSPNPDAGSREFDLLEFDHDSQARPPADPVASVASADTPASQPLSAPPLAAEPRAPRTVSYADEEFMDADQWAPPRS